MACQKPLTRKKMKNIIAVVGRPNVGKSTFFNKVIGERKSVVNNLPGVTRDRVYGESDWSGVPLTFIDTGGMVLEKPEEINKSINLQAELAMDIADVILFLVDAKEGLNPADHLLAKYLKQRQKSKQGQKQGKDSTGQGKDSAGQGKDSKGQCGKAKESGAQGKTKTVPILLVANKVDNPQQNTTQYDFYNLGLGSPIPISAEHSLGTGDLLDEILAKLNAIPQDLEEESKLKIAVIGKPNVGKSSLINKLLKEDRLIVSDVAGTTIDAIDTPISVGGKDYIIVDTAGIRRKRSIELDSVEYYSVVRSFIAIRRADVVLIVLDANEPISEQDVRLAGYVDSQGKPSVVVLNKWDLAKQDAYTINTHTKNLQKELDFMAYFKPIFVSALTGQRIEKIFELVDYVHFNASRRIQTSILNEALRDATSAVEPQSVKGRRLKIKYITQDSTNPPTFILFVNDATLLKDNYKRYLENSFRKAFNFEGTPIKILPRSD